MCEPLVSFIVPVYNAATYLPACVDSILAQTQPNFEVLLVNDGSTDDSGRLCDAYAAQDARIKVFHQTNQGVSAARNAGLCASQGVWICFVDSDDQVEPTLIQQLLPRFENYELVCFGRQLLLGRTCRPVLYGSSFPLDSDARLEWMAGMLNPDRPAGYDFTRLATASCWGKLYRRALLRRLKAAFRPGLVFGEDMLFNLQVFHGVQSAFYTDQPLYLYRMETGSAMRRFRSEAEREFSLLCRLLEAFVEQEGLSSVLGPRLLERRLIALGYVITLCLCHKDNPLPFIVRRHRFLQLVQQSLYAEPLCCVPLNQFPFAKRLLFSFARHRCFLFLDLATKAYH